MAVMPDDVYLNKVKQNVVERGAKLYKERDEIAEKLLTLTQYVKSTDYLNDSSREVELISNQLQFMNCYHAVLVARIQLIRDEQVALSGISKHKSMLENIDNERFPWKG